jgi:hypothetical protein
MFHRESEYRIVDLNPEEGIVFIVDTDHGDRPSVTNDAERVVMVLNKQYPGHRILYRDTMGHWDELVHKDGNFLGFKPGYQPERLPS